MNLSYKVELLNLLSVDDIVEQLKKIGFKVEIVDELTSVTINFSCEQELSPNDLLVVGAIIGHIKAIRYA